MPYDFHWHDDDRSIIWIDTYGEASWDALNQITDEILEEVDATSRRVDLIVHDEAGMPKGNPFAPIRSLVNKFERRKNIGLVTLIGANYTAAFVKMVLEVTSKIIGFQHLKFVDTVEEAIAIIEEDRQKTKAEENKV